MHAAPVVREGIAFLQPLHEVVGIEDSFGSRPPQSGCAHHDHIGIGFHDDTEVAVKAVHLTDT